MTVAIIDYGSGNLRSAAKAFERASGKNHSVKVTNSPKDIASASHIVLPGVGAFGDCMRGLSSLPGMIDALRESVLQQGRWFLGICVGMQLLFERGREHGDHAGLGWLKGEVVPLSDQWSESGVQHQKSALLNSELRSLNTFKIPHMGWNDLKLSGDHPLTHGLKPDDHAYFVHSYHARCTDEKDIAATVDYGQAVTAIVAKNNIMGTQFHPEKSQQAGLALIGNFLAL